jgi:peptide/nickel transport system permease protein
MASVLIQRIVLAILLAIFLSVASFLLVFASGDPAAALAGEQGRAADVEKLRQAYGLDRPLYVQYFSWLSGIVRGDFGRSLYFQQPISTLLAGRFGITMLLGLLAILFALVVAVPLGIVAAYFRNTLIDRLALLIGVTGQAMPTFWFALLLIVLFGVIFPILPTSGFESWQHMILPAVVLGFTAMPAIMRLTRSGMITALDTDYIRTARAMGISSRAVLFKYALRNAVIPVVSLSAAQFGFMLAGSVVVEHVFAINGAGRLAWESVMRSDLPTIQALVLCFSLIYVALTLFADMLNAWLDPRIRG